MTLPEAYLVSGEDRNALECLRQQPMPKYVLDRIAAFHRNWLDGLSVRNPDAADHISILELLVKQNAAPSIATLVAYMEEGVEQAPSYPSAPRYLFTLLIIVHAKLVDQPLDDPSVLDRWPPYIELETTRSLLAARQLAHTTPSCSHLHCAVRL